MTYRFICWLSVRRCPSAPPRSCPRQSFRRGKGFVAGESAAFAVSCCSISFYFPFVLAILSNLSAHFAPNANLLDSVEPKMARSLSILAMDSAGSRGQRSRHLCHFVFQMFQSQFLLSAPLDSPFSPDCIPIPSLWHLFIDSSILTINSSFDFSSAEFQFATWW